MGRLPGGDHLHQRAVGVGGLGPLRCALERRRGADLRRPGKWGISSGGLLGGNDDQVVANATLLLPALMAEKGLAPPITLEANTQALPGGDRATGTPGSDWMRKYGAAVGMATLTFIGGLGWAAWILFRERPFGGANVVPIEEEDGGLPE